MRAKKPTHPAVTKREIFVETYLSNGGNATDAAKVAGYSANSAHVEGSRLLKHAEVKARIAQRTAIVVQRAQQISNLTVERTLQEVARLAYFDVRKLYNENGALKPIHELDDDTAAALAQVEVGEMKIDGVVVGHATKVKQWNKNAAIEKAMKHLGLYKEDNTQRGASITLNVAFGR